MSYNGYGMENQFAAYADGGPSYLDSSYGAYGADPILSTSTSKSQEAATMQLQGLLIARGFGAFLGSGGADGDYGSATEKAVKAFQQAARLPATGVADQATWNALRGTAAATTGTSASPYTGTWVSNLFKGLGIGLGTQQPGAVPVTGGTIVPPPEEKKMWPWVVGGLSLVALMGAYVYFKGKAGDKAENEGKSSPAPARKRARRRRR